MRLFLDANVLFTAAHNPGGRSAALFELARAGVCTLVTSPHAIEEARRNLQLKYPRAVDTLERLLDKASVGPEASSKAVAWALEQGLPLVSTHPPRSRSGRPVSYAQNRANTCFNPLPSLSLGETWTSWTMAGAARCFNPLPSLSLGETAEHVERVALRREFQPTPLAFARGDATAL